MLGLLYPNRRKGISSSRPPLRLSLLTSCMKRHYPLLLPPRVKVVTSPIKKKKKNNGEDAPPPSLHLDRFSEKEIVTAINRVYEDGARARKLSYLLGLLDR